MTSCLNCEGPIVRITLAGLSTWVHTAQATSMTMGGVNCSPFVKGRVARPDGGKMKEALASELRPGYTIKAGNCDQCGQHITDIRVEIPEQPSHYDSTLTPVTRRMWAVPCTHLIPTVYINPITREITQ